MRRPTRAVPRLSRSDWRRARASSWRRVCTTPIHERYREELVPDLDAIRSLLEAVGAGPAVLSGAGPTVIALVQELTDARALERARALAEVARTALDGIGRGRVLALPIDRAGARQSA